MKNKLSEIRRVDRQQNDISFLYEILENSISCSIAVEANDFPLIHVTFFAFDKKNNDIIFHFSKHGYGGEQLTDGKKVSVSIFKYGKLYTAEKAIDFGCEYESIIVYSTLRIIQDSEERTEAMQLFFDRFFNQIPRSAYTDFTTSEISSIFIVKIKVDKWFGKRHLVPEQKAKISFYPEVNPVI